MNFFGGEGTVQPITETTVFLFDFIVLQIKVCQFD